MVKYKYTLQKDKEDLRDYQFSDIMLKNIDLPSEKIIEGMPKIWDQKDAGTCSSNSVLRGLSFVLKDVDTELSRLFHYFMSRKLEGYDTSQDTGCTNRGSIKSANVNGCCLEKFNPYITKNLAVPPTQEAIDDAKNRKSHSYYSVKNLQELKIAINKNLPVVIGMSVHEEFEDENFNGYLYEPKKTSKLLGYHSVIVEGYKDDKQENLGFFKRLFKKISCKISGQQESGGGFLKVANSWGTDWGVEGGYFYMSYKYFQSNTFDYWVQL